MAVSIKRRVEAVVCELIEQSPGISSTLAVMPSDGDDRGATNRVVVSAEIEEDFLDGPKGHTVRIEAKLYMMKGPLTTPYFDMYSRAIQLSLQKAPVTTPVNLADFIYFCIDDIDAEEPEVSGKVRTRAINATAKVKLVHTQLGVLLGDDGEPVTDDLGYPIETRPEDNVSEDGFLLDDEGNLILDDQGQPIQTVT